MDIQETLIKMPDAAEYPKTLETHRALLEIAQDHICRIKAEAEKLSPTEKLQKKASMIAKNMAQHCTVFTCYTYGSTTVEGFCDKRLSMLRNHAAGMLDEYEEGMSALSPDERGAFLLFAHATWFIHNAFLDKHSAEIVAAYESGHPERAFEANIIVRVLNTICGEWLAWWRENGTLAFEKWTYDVHPADRFLQNDGKDEVS